MDILSSAHTWFFDSIHFDIEGTLIVEIIEGIKGIEKELVNVDENTTLGSYYPVRVSEKSRAVSIQFLNVLTYTVLTESYDIGDEKLEKAGDFLYKCTKSSYLENVIASTSIGRLEKDFSHYLLWTEDYLINVITKKEPIVELLNRLPKLDVERSDIYVTR